MKCPADRSSVTQKFGVYPFLQDVYIPGHNARFVKVLKSDLSASVRFAGNIRDILCVYEERVVSSDNIVRYKDLVLQIAMVKHRNYFVKVKVRFHAYPDGEPAVFHGPLCIVRYQSDELAIK